MAEIRNDKPHVVLFKTGPPPHVFEPNKYKPGECWYVALYWFKSRGFMQGGTIGQINLIEGWTFYAKALSIAIKWGKKLGVVAIVNSSGKIIWRPKRGRTKQQEKLLQELLSEKKIGLII